MEGGADQGVGRGSGDPPHVDGWSMLSVKMI